MVFKGLLCALLALCVGHVAALDLTSAKWIWSDSNWLKVNPYVTRDFRRVFSAPAGKTPSSAQIIITADNNYTLYVNGELIGQGNDFTTSQKYCVGLNATCDNVFAVAAENLSPPNPNPAALIAAVQVDYTDGTSDTFVTDGSWRANVPTPGFEKITFDDSSWLYAYVIPNPFYAPPKGPYDSSSLTITDSTWVWTNEVPPNSPGSSAPVGSRAFRKTIDVPGRASVSSGVIIIGADNAYVLYVNGKEIGTGNTWTVAQRWKFKLEYATDDIVIAVNATNSGGPAGLIVSVALDVTECDTCSTTLFYTTDSSWKYSLTVPSGFEQPGYGDSGWGNAVIEGPYGVAPWGKIPVQDGK